MLLVCCAANLVLVDESEKKPVVTVKQSEAILLFSAMQISVAE